MLRDHPPEGSEGSSLEIDSSLSGALSGEEKPADKESQKLKNPGRRSTAEFGDFRVPQVRRKTLAGSR